MSTITGYLAENGQSRMGLTFEAWKHQKVNLTRARKYLSQVNASQRVKQYHEWKEIGQALYAIDCKIGLELWKTWTQEHLGPHSCVQEWKTFMPRTSADQLSLHELQHESTRFSNSLVLYRQEQGPEQDRDFRIHLKDQLYLHSKQQWFVIVLIDHAKHQLGVTGTGSNDDMTQWVSFQDLPGQWIYYDSTGPSSTEAEEDSRAEAPKMQQIPSLSSSWGMSELRALAKKDQLLLSITASDEELVRDFETLQERQHKHVRWNAHQEDLARVKKILRSFSFHEPVWKEVGKACYAISSSKAMLDCFSEWTHTSSCMTLDLEKPHQRSTKQKRDCIQVWQKFGPLTTFDTKGIREAKRMLQQHQGQEPLLSKELRALEKNLTNLDKLEFFSSHDEILLSVVSEEQLDVDAVIYQNDLIQLLGSSTIWWNVHRINALNGTLELFTDSNRQKVIHIRPNDLSRGTIRRQRALEVQYKLPSLTNAPWGFQTLTSIQAQVRANQEDDDPSERRNVACLPELHLLGASESTLTIGWCDTSVRDLGLDFQYWQLEMDDPPGDLAENPKNKTKSTSVVIYQGNQGGCQVSRLTPDTMFSFRLRIQRNLGFDDILERKQFKTACLAPDPPSIGKHILDPHNPLCLSLVIKWKSEKQPGYRYWLQSCALSGTSSEDHEPLWETKYRGVQTQIMLYHVSRSTRCGFRLAILNHTNGRESQQSRSEWSNVQIFHGLG